MAEERVQRRLAAILAADVVVHCVSANAAQLAADGEGDELMDVVLVIVHPALLVVARVWGRYSRPGTESRSKFTIP